MGSTGLSQGLCVFVCVDHRRINIEEKAKVVAAVLGAEFIQYLAVVAVLH